MDPDPRTAPTDLEPGLLDNLDASYKRIRPFEAWVSGCDVDLAIWQRWSEQLEQQRKDTGADLQREVRDAAVRAAAFNTGAIEGLHPPDRGLTFTLATLATGWQDEIERVQGSDTLTLVEAAIEGYELALDLATRSEGLGQVVTEVAIRSLHEVVCGPQATYTVLTRVGRQERNLPKGVYKTDPNHVQLRDGSTHAYAPVASTDQEMRRLVAELQGRAFLEAHPVLQAAYSHHALATIHPFADGNGRVARLLASVYFLRAASIPLVVFADRRSEYFDALEAADRGTIAPFVRFARDRGVDTMAIGSQLLASAELGSLDAASVRRSLGPRDGDEPAMNADTVDAAALDLLDDVVEKLRDAVERSIPDDVSFSSSPTGYPGEVTPGDQPGEQTRVIPGYLPAGRELTVTHTSRVRMLLGVVVSADSQRCRLEARIERHGEWPELPSDTVLVEARQLLPRPDLATDTLVGTFAGRVAERAVQALVDLEGRHEGPPAAD